MTENEDKKLYAKQIKAIKTKTKKKMVALGTYSTEFDFIIERYADLTVQYAILKDKWYESGCVVVERYTNKHGETAERKATVLAVMESTRKELSDLEAVLGLTPKSLKQITAKVKAQQETKNSFEQALENLSD